jgi:methyl-accepting chemotaxis protein/methyl-accepting chemotaxis protein-1 (serine sensor receptor)
MRQVIEELRAAGRSAEDETAVDAIRSGLEQWVRMSPDFISLSVAGHADDASHMALQTITPVMDTIQKNAADLGQSNRSRRDAALARVEDSADSNLSATIIMTVLLLAAAAGAFLVVAHLVRALREISRSVSAGAAGLAAASGEITAAGNSLAEGSSEQAASLEETSAAVEEISSAARRNNENSQTAANMVSASGDKFAATERGLDLMVTAIQAVNASSDKISRIIKVIDGIAFQTNIPALNAAVEAARAGEAGTGFAVVADEVRGLAHRSAQAARDTASLIEESIAKSNEGRARVDEVASAIRTVSADAAKVKNLVDEVNGSSRKQATGLEQIAKAIRRMEQVTQATAASAEQTASAAGRLTAQSESLNNGVGRLTALVGAA